MISFDVSMIIIMLLILPYSFSKVAAYLITLHMVVQFAFDILFFDLGLSSMITSYWFFIIKGHIIFAAIFSLYYMTSHFSILLILSSAMLYEYGMSFEVALGREGFFYNYFEYFMAANAIAQLIFLIGTTNVARNIRRAFGIRDRRWTNRNFRNTLHNNVV